MKKKPFETFASEIMQQLSVLCLELFRREEAHFTADGVQATITDTGVHGDNQEYTISIVPLYRYHVTPVLEAEEDRLMENALEDAARQADWENKQTINNKEIPAALPEDLELRRDKA